MNDICGLKRSDGRPCMMAPAHRGGCWRRGQYGALQLNGVWFIAAALLLFAVPAVADPAPKTFPAGGCNTCTDLGNGFAECTLAACGVKMPVLALAPTSPVATENAPLPADAPTEERCADGPPDVPLASVCLEQGQPAPFRARALSFGEHQRRERINARNADLWLGITQGDVLVVSKVAFYALIATSTAALVASIILGGLAFAHKL